MHRMLVAAIGLLAMAPAASARIDHLDLAAGNLKFSFRPGSGALLLKGGVPVLRESHLYIVKPGWSGMLMNQDQTTGEYAYEPDENGAKVGTVTFDTDDAYARYRFKVAPDDTFTVTVTYGSKGKPAEVEYDFGYINANILQGEPYTAQTVEGPKSGVVPTFAASEDQTKSKLTPDLSSIVFASKIGRIAITVTGDNPTNSAFTLFDARGGSQDWARLNPVFWFGIGVPTKPVKEGDNTVTLTYKFGAPIPNTTTPAITGGAPIYLKTATIPSRPSLPVIPHPKKMTQGKGGLRLSGAVRIVAGSSPEEQQGARELKQDLKELWRVEAAIVAPSARRAKAGTDIVLTKGASQPVAPRHAEGYALSVTADRAVVNGYDARGAYYGAQTMKQLLRVDAKGVYLQAAEVKDWPSLGMRGVHWFGGPKSVPFHEAMISRICAAMKMNMMLYQVDYSQWKSQPNIYDSRSTPLADVKKSVDAARRHFMEPIPLVNGLGHSDWMFVNGQNLDVATDPIKRYQYDPSKARVYTDILFPVMQEAIDIFKPKYFNIGRDEITTGGLFPPKGSTRSATDLILEDVVKVNNWVRSKGLTTMMWGDEFLHYPEEATDAGNAPSVEEAQKRRAGLPKDIIITDWHYAATPTEYPSIDIWHKNGNKVVGCPWYERGNIENFARCLTQQKAMGLCQTTWAGYVMSTDIVKGPSFNQFVAYLLAAEYAWNGGSVELAKLGYDPDEAFLLNWDRKPVDTRKRSGFAVSIPSFEQPAGLPVANWPGTAAKPATLTLGGTTFRAAAPLWLAGALNPAGEWPKGAYLPVGGKAHELRFLWASTLRAAADTPVAKVTIAYEDGTKQEASITYARGIFAFDDLRGGGEAPMAWTGKTSDGRPAAARRWTWVNPSPAKTIQSVTVTSEGSEAAPVLLAITGVE